jgi:eukaryotic-like serine/threonine-protein kinase
MKFSLAFILSILLGFTLQQAVPGQDSPTGKPINDDPLTNKLFLPFVQSNYRKAELVYIPAGAFEMGCNPAHNNDFACPEDEKPQHTVTLDAYYIYKYEVTNKEYAQCVKGGGCQPPTYSVSFSRASYYGDPGFDNYPVVYVGWQSATDYCAWVGMRLPTEAEWEKAARGASGPVAYPWGDNPPTCSLANYYDNIADDYCTGDTSAVGSYPSGASVYGVMDMAGNVNEWVSDWYGKDYYKTSPGVNPQGPASGTYKVLRSGSFGAFPDLIRTSYRALFGGIHDGSNGFRCAGPLD